MGNSCSGARRRDLKDYNTVKKRPFGKATQHQKGSRPIKNENGSYTNNNGMEVGDPQYDSNGRKLSRCPSSESSNLNELDINEGVDESMIEIMHNHIITPEQGTRKIPSNNCKLFLLNL